MIPGYRFYHQYLSPYLSEPEKKDRTFAGLTLATLFILGIFAIRPTFASIASLSLEINRGKANEKVLEEKVNSLRKAQKNYQEVENNLHLLEEALPSKRNSALLLSEIGFILSKNNLTLEEVYFKEPSSHTDPNFIALPFSVQAQGQYADFIKALSDFEKSLHPKDIESLRVVYQGKTKNLEIVFNLKTYYYE